MADLIGLIVALLALIVAYFSGSFIEKRHYAHIKTREAQLRNILLFNEKRPPANAAGSKFALVSGSAVMSSDHFRQTIAALKTLFGGRLTSYESMLDRGRREAILRMKEEARRQGANAIFNVRLETATLNANDPKQQVVCAEILAYGTAFSMPVHNT
jgi:uncharacterized protein YbjQ (UPF0145 family)